MKHSRQSFIGYPNTSNFVKNTPLRVVFSTLFSVFGYPDETQSLVFDILHNSRYLVCRSAHFVSWSKNLLKISLCSSRPPSCSEFGDFTRDGHLFS